MRFSPPVRAALVRFSAVVLLATGISLTPAVSGSAPRPGPVSPTVTEIPIQGIDAGALRSAPVPTFEGQPSGSGLHLVTLTSPRATQTFAVLGITWSGATPAGVVVNVRVREAGRWTPWQRLDADQEHGPNAGTQEAAHARLGTAPFVTGRADGVQVRVDSRTSAPRTMRLVLIDPGASPADGAMDRATPSGLGTAAAAAVQPTVYTRAQWGADESLRGGPPSYGTIRAAFVHHTVGTNSYTATQVPGIIRGIYAYHVQSRGWNDIGYNFLVDKWGRLWEGRYGGIGLPVIGAHTLGFNEESFSLAALGTYTSTAPSSAVLSAYARLFSWKLGMYRLDPTSSVAMSDDAGVRTFRRVSGHRDANATECPGAALYAKLSAIRSESKVRQGTMFYSLTTTRGSWRYGDANGTIIKAGLSKPVTWRVRVRDCAGTIVATVTGTSTTTTGLVAKWNGRLANGALAPPGHYPAEVTAWSGTGTANVAIPWWGTFRVDASDGTRPAPCP